VAHQDDETACSVLLQRAREARVVFATNGAPPSDFFWHRYGSRQQYAAVRHAEALQSLGVIGITEATFLQDAARQDQELYRFLPSALEALELARHFKPDALVTPAYEGGHPDYDACSFLARSVGHSLSVSR
jgi:N-acetylglucosamine malate deacetylase 2